tara:strand:- start:362 stop:472 length:111 start_codon:yes stop_codon:yes gene_type:complete
MIRKGAFSVSPWVDRQLRLVERFSTDSNGFQATPGA